MKNFFFAFIIATAAFGIYDTTKMITAEVDAFDQAQAEFVEFYNNN